MRIRSFSFILGALALSACSGGGGAVPVSPAASAAPAKAGGPSTNVTLTIAFPSRHAATARARLAPQYVSPNTTGLIVVVTSGSGANVSTDATGYTIGAAAPNCRTTGGVTTCTLSIAAPVGSDGFAAYTYAAGQGKVDGSPDTTITTPVSPNSLLSEQTGLTQTIVEDAANTVAFHLQPVIASVVASEAVVSAPGNLTPAVPLPFEALDASGNAPSSYVVAGSGPTNGAYRTPIALSVAESNAIVPGTATLSTSSLATTDDAPSLTLEASAQQPASTSSALYSATVTAILPADSGDGFAGATNFAASTASIQVAPLYLVVQTGPDNSVLIDALAAKQPSGAGYTITDSSFGGSGGCQQLDPVNVPTTGTEVARFFEFVSPSPANPANGSTIGCIDQVSDGTGTTTPTRALYAPSGSPDVVISPFVQTVMSSGDEMASPDYAGLEASRTSSNDFPAPVQAGDVVSCIAAEGSSATFDQFIEGDGYAEDNKLSASVGVLAVVAGFSTNSVLQVVSDGTPYAIWCGELSGTVPTSNEVDTSTTGTSSPRSTAPDGSSSVLLTYLASQSATPIATSSGYIQFGVVGASSPEYSLSVQVYGSPAASGSSNGNTFADSSSTSANDIAGTAYFPLTGPGAPMSHLRTRSSGAVRLPATAIR